MKIYVGEQGNYISDTKGVPKEELDNMVQVDELPKPEEREGYTAKLRANLSTQTVYYEYEKNPEVETLKLLLSDAISLLEESGDLQWQK